MAVIWSPLTKTSDSVLVLLGLLLGPARATGMRKKPGQERWFVRSGGQPRLGQAAAPRLFLVGVATVFLSLCMRGMCPLAEDQASRSWSGLGDFRMGS